MRSLLFIIIIFLFSQAVYPQADWDKKVDGNEVSYIPNTLKSDEYFTITVINNVALNARSTTESLKKYISNRINEKWKLTGIGKVIAAKEGPIKGALRTYARFNTDDFSDMTAIFVAIPIANSKMTIMQVNYSHDSLVKRYQDKIGQLGNDLGNTKFTKTHPKAKSTAQNNPEIPVKKISGIKGIAIISNFGLDVYSRTYKLKSSNILLFEDGRFSNDLETILEKGVGFSQKNNPDEWGKFKISNEKLSLKYNDSNQYDVQEYFTLYPPNPENTKLMGCWDSSKTFEFSDGVSTGSGMGISGYCFDEDGRFSKDNTFGFSGGIENSAYGKALKLPVGSYSSASEKSQLGWYRIDEYTIQLDYDDGTKETKFIGIDEMLLLDYGQLFKIEE